MIDRMDYAIKQLSKHCAGVDRMDSRTLRFFHNGHPITVFPYTGWWTGKGVGSGRGIEILINKLKEKTNDNTD